MTRDQADETGSSDGSTRLNDAGELILSDPRAIRALAHPARQRLLDLLVQEQGMTATEAAAKVGISPSAMSYHLRALAKWGIVERLEASGDGRERPWHLVSEAIQFTNESGARANALAGRAFTSTFTQRLLDHLERLDREVMKGGQRAEGGLGITLVHSSLLLTADESEEVQEKITALLAPYRNRRAGQAECPPDAKRRSLYYLSLPEVDDPPPSEKRGGGN